MSRSRDLGSTTYALLLLGIGLLLLVASVLLCGCAVSAASMGNASSIAPIPPTPPTSRPVEIRDVCFTRPEIAQILAQKHRRRAEIERCEARRVRDRAECKIGLESKMRPYISRLALCEGELVRSRSCPAPILPWIVVGIVGAVGVGGMVVVGILAAGGGR